MEAHDKQGMNLLQNKRLKKSDRYNLYHTKAQRLNNIHDRRNVKYKKHKHGTTKGL